MENNNEIEIQNTEEISMVDKQNDYNENQNIVTTLGLRRPGEQVSTLTSGTCPPPGFHPNALRITTH